MVFYLGVFRWTVLSGKQETARASRFIAQLPAFVLDKQARPHAPRARIHTHTHTHTPSSSTCRPARTAPAKPGARALQAHAHVRANITTTHRAPRPVDTPRREGGREGGREERGEGRKGERERERERERKREREREPCRQEAEGMRSFFENREYDFSYSAADPSRVAEADGDPE